MSINRKKEDNMQHIHMTSDDLGRVKTPHMYTI